MRTTPDTVKMAHDTTHAIEDAFPLSMLQQGMLFHSALDAQLGVYHDAFLYKVETPWIERKFRDALNHVVDRHAVLRTVYKLDGARPLQVVLKSKAPALAIEDLSEYGDDEQEKIIAERLAAERLIGIDPTKHVWKAFVYVLGRERIQCGISFHHALWDGWSVATFISELFAAYGALLQGTAAPNGEKPPSYRSFVALEQQALGSSQNKVYWADKLAGARTPWWTQEKKGPSERFDCEISPEQSEKVIALAGELGVAEKSLWCAVYLTLISLLDGSEDVVGCVATHGRPEIPHSEKMLGLFLNTLPIRVDLRGGRWVDLIKTVDRELREQYAYRHHPVVDVQNQTGLSFTASMFGYLNFHVFGQSDVRSKILGGQGFEETNYHMVVSVEKIENLRRHSFSVRADSRLFDAARRAHIRAYVGNIIDSITADKQGTIVRGRLIGRGERELQLIEWNASRPVDANENDTVLSAFRWAVGLRGGAHALVDGEATVSFQELDARSSRSARVLISQRAPVGKVVAIRLSAGIELVTAVLAALKAGCSYAIIDVRKSPQRQSWMIRNSAAKFLIEDDALPDPSRLIESVRRIATRELSSAEDATESSSRTRLRRSGRAVDSLVCSYSIAALSWGEGSDQAFSFTHASLVRCGCEETDQILGRLKGLDAVSVSLWASLLSGQALDLQQLRSALDEPRSVPDSFSPAQLVQRKADELYVVKDDDLVPLGTEGELCIGGEAIADHVYGDTPLSAARWIPHPFSQTPGRRLFKTGLTGRFDADGTLQIGARQEEGAKQASLKKIEELLRRHDDVRDVAVEREESFGGPGKIVAYCVFAGEVAELSAEIFAAASSAPQPCSLPAAIVRVESIPRLPNGRVDFTKLPSPYASIREERFEWPLGLCEELLAGIWSDLLKCGRVSRHANFFRLGGYSLVGMQLVGRIREVFGVELPLREVFECEDLKTQAQLIQRSQPSAQLPPIQRVDRSQPLPVSFAQQRLWFLSRMMPPNSVYNIPLALRLSGEVNAGALVRSLQEIVRRHEALRTRFVEAAGQAVQVIDAPSEHCVVVEEIEGEEALQARCVAEREYCFDLSHEPLYRLRLLHTRFDGHWVLLATFHHIIADGWSFGVFFQELSQLYRAAVMGQSTTLAPLPIQYADYAHWQRQVFDGEVLQRQLDYWKSHLAGAPALLELPADRIRPAMQSYRGGGVAFSLSEEISEQLKGFSRKHGATLFMTLYAGFAMVLAKLSRQRDLVIGTPVAGRSQSAVEGLIGFFINTLPLRVTLRDDMTVGALLKQVKTTLLSAYSHQEIAFERVVEAVQPPRTLSHSPIFQVMFALQNAPLGEVALPGLTVAPMSMSSNTEKFDLSVSLQEAGKQIVGTFNYATDLFERSTLERWVEHFKVVLTALVQSADRKVGDITPLSAGQYWEAVERFNATERAYPSDASIQELFEAQAERVPHAIAVVDGRETIDYIELNRRANQLARYLRNRGVGPDELVGICVERGIGMVVGLLGIVKAGAAYLPLDPSYPRERLEYMLRDTSPQVVLTQEHTRAALPTTSADIVSLDNVWPVIAQLSDHNLTNEVGLIASHLAYVNYTSGSTGAPKGIAVTHRNVVRLVANTFVPFEQLQSFLCVASPSFDALTFEIWGPLLHGKRSVLFELKAHSLRELGDVVRRQQVDCAFLTTALFNQVVVDDVQAWRSVKYLLVGGEAASKELMQRARDQLPSLALSNIYGPTENTTFSCMYRIHASRIIDWMSIPIGGPIDHSTAYVLDERGQLTPIGSVGELYVGGVGLARGYVNKPGLTAEKFVPHPFSKSPGERLYRTGDLVRRRVDGNLEFVGRVDTQVKIRGFRIELTEIDSHLIRHPRVHSCVVTVREDVPGRKRLVAYYTAKFTAKDMVPDADELREHLAAQLPEYMVPGAYVLLDSIPLNANGKVDLKALPAPQSDAYAVEEYEAPQGATEEMLAGIWSDLIPGPRVGRTDNFFSIGGYSLIGVQLVSRVRDVFGVELTLRELFEQQTLLSQARLIEAKSASEPQLPPLVVADRSRPLRLSFAQQRLWFLSRMMPPNAVYNIPLALRLSGEVNEAALVQSLQAIVHRHEALRTRFVEVEGQAAQVIDPPSERCVVVEDIESEAALRARCAAEREYCFDLSREPLYRLRLLRTRFDSHWVLLATLHHIIADGWSLGVFFQELARLYRSAVQAEDARLEPLPIQYADYAQWQREHLSGSVLAGQLQYWEGQLAGLPPLLQLPTDHPRPAEQSYRGTSVNVHLPAQLVERVQAVNRRCGTTLFMSLIATLAVLLSRYARQSDVAIGTPVVNRRHSQTEGLIGFFLNNLVLRFELGSDVAAQPLSFETVLSRTREMALQAYAHQDIPFEHLVERLNPVRSLSHAPLFQVSCSLVDTPVKAGSFAGLKIAPLELGGPGSVARYDLTLNFSQLADGSLLGSLEYNTDLFEAATMQRLLVHYERLLEALSSQPQRALREVEFLTPEERHQQLIEWNPSRDADPRVGSYPAEQTLPQLFEAQVERQPEAIAVVDGGAWLSYAELNRRANRVAHYLLEQGVKPDEGVGLCVERSLELVVGLLGILKAGGAYVPLDPSYPPSRLQQMIATAGCRVILSEQHLLEELPFLSEHAVLPLDGRWHEALLGSYASDTPSVELTPDHLAYVVYTSGSTGTPKGIAVSHRNVVRLVFNRFVPYEQLQSFLCAASPSFDAFTFELWGALLHGKRLVLFELKAQSLEGMDEVIRSQQVECAWLTAGLFNQVIVHRPAALQGLKYLLVGGEALSKEHIQRAREQLPGVTLVNGYGPTENTTFSCTYAIEERRVADLPSIPIGQPIDHSTAYVLDEQGGLVPNGCVGELYVGGAGLARGYIHNAALTAEKFVPHPYSESPGQRLYRTGDLVRRRADGNIEYLGRIDAQVKVRGFRIELGEVESVLGQHARVRAVAVIAQVERANEARLIAYVVGEAGVDAEELKADLLSHLQGRIPDYAVPSALVLLESLPLTRNGKLDRARLPQPDESAYARRRYVAPRTALEETLVGLWQRNLQLAQIGIEDNYFAIGGDSIRSISLVSAAKARGVRFSIKDLFAHPTIGELARIAAEGEAEESAASALAPFELLTPSERGRLPEQYAGERIEDAYPMSQLQQGMWFHSLQNPTSAVYHCVITFAVQAEWRPEVFGQALDRVIARHAILRTQFYFEAERPLQLVLAARAPIVAVYDYRERLLEQRESLVRDWALEERRQGLSLEQLWRIGVMVFAEGQIQFGLSFHHALWDGWSDATFTAELFTCYQALLRGQEPALTAPPPGYHHYIALEQAALNNPEHEEYWARTLAGAKLPWWSAHPQQEAKNFYCEITPGMSAAMMALTDELGVQEKSVWCAVYVALTALLDGSESILGSVVTHGRPELEHAEKTIGLFLNSLPLQVKVRGRTWAQLIAAVDEQLRQLQQHRHYPLAKIQAQSRLDFSGSLFNFVNFHVLSDSTERSNVQGIGAFGFDDTNYSFAVDVQKDEAANRHLFRVTVDPTVFDAEFQERIRRQVANIIARMTRDRSEGIEPARMLDAEQRRILEFSRGQNLGGRGASAGVAADAGSQRRCVHELIEDQVARRPHDVAVVCGNQKITYAELNSKANRLAHYLVAHGVRPDELVAICVERGIEMIVGLLGILKAGAGYVPLDPRYPGERLEYMLEDAAPRVLLTQERLKGTLPRHGAQEILLDRDWETIGKQDASNLDTTAIGLRPSCLAYVIYTSGSTGQPKGVMVAHENVVNHNLFVSREFAFTCDDRVLQFATFCFDASVEEIFPILMAGGSLAIRSEATPSPAELSEQVVRERITVLDLPTAYWHVWISSLDAESLRRSPLRLVIVGGEKVSTDSVQKWRQIAAPHQAWVNTYGPTEATIICSIYGYSGTDPVNKVSVQADRAIPIGAPISNTQLYICDSRGSLAPIGVPGELYIGGAGLARGYLRRPRLTAERFAADPFGPAGARIYKSGDLARWRSDGLIEYLGRNDDQIKIRGFRVELGEIESQLGRHAAIEEVVVIAREDVPGDIRLVAYFTAHADATPGYEELRAHLLGSLPNYMIPSAFVALESLPLTANGKVDRKALPAPEADISRAYAAPQGEVESVLAGIWQELLQVARIGRDDNFFELGGHSLLAMQLVARIRQSLGRELALRQLFEHPTLQTLAKRLLTAGESADTPIEPADRDRPLPLSLVQQRIWFESQLEEASSAYHMCLRIGLLGKLDESALRAALDTLLARHESLRTVFKSVAGVAVQEITQESAFALRFVDLRSYTPAQREGQIKDEAVAEAGAPFDLGVGPLIRGRLLRVADEEHELLLTLHHIVADGWSLGVLIKELGILYAAYREGRGDPLPPLSIQYADYAQWQRQWLQGEVLARQVGYWKERLTGAPALLELPTDRPRPVVRSYRGASIAFELSAELTGRLKALSRQQDVTVFMTLHAALTLLLSRLTGQEDIVIGIPAANRQRSEVEGLIGFFVNTLALRMRLGDQLDVRALLEQAKDAMLGAYGHQELPFEQVVEALRPPRALSHSPVFQVMLALQNTPQQALTLPGLTLAPRETGGDRAQFDLTLSLHDAGDVIVGGMNYATDLFDPSTIERWINHFKTVLTGMTQGAAVRLDSIALLTQREREHLIRGFNATAVDYARYECAHGLFEEHVRQTPDAPALVCDSRTLTYRELNEEANQLAHYLRERGAGPDQLIAICVEQGHEMVIGILGILKAGAAYVPLDPTYPRERLEYMLEDAAPRIVLTQERLRPVLPDTEADVISLDQSWSQIATHSSSDSSAADVGLTSRQLAYVIYTSGSTGRPKGVMVEHATLTAFSIARRVAYGKPERMLLLSSIAFDASVSGIFGTLANGGTLCIANAEIVRDPARLMQEIGRLRITDLICVPSLYQSLLLLAESGAGEAATALSRVVVAGEACTPALVESWQRTKFSARLINEYGPTETTVWATAFECASDRVEVCVPIGRPIANTQVYILDRHGEPVPVGVSGEIHIGGAGVARGYLNRPELTAERFSTDPFGARAGARIYRTGDVGRWRPDGNIEFLGRNDHQVKIRGYRIELGEVESQLMQLGQMQEVVVVAREDVPGDKRLVAYYTPKDARALPGVDELRAHLRGRLPEYMVPAAFVALETLPLTPNGKLDRKALPAPEGAAYSRGSYEAPQGETEETLASIWRQLLNLQQVGRHDNFFDLGGHSLLATRLTASIQGAFGRQIPLREVFAAPTIAELADRLRVIERAMLPSIAIADRAAPLPLSFAQQRLWFIAQLPSTGTVYHMPLALRLRGPLDSEALRAALAQVVERHEALRTTFVQNDVGVVQVISSPGRFALEMFDSSGIPEPERQAQVRSLLDTGMREPFDLAAGPLFRGALVKLESQDHVLLLTMHHIISDGWSLGVLMREVAILYSAQRRGAAAVLPPLPIQYADYSVWQRQWLQGEVLRQQLEYWKAHLDGAPALLELPADHARPPMQSHRGGNVAFTLDQALGASIRQVARQHDATLFMTLYAGFALLLAKLSGQQDVVIGVPVANRSRAEVEGLIGFFVNTLALRVQVLPRMRVSDLIRAVREATLEGYGRQETPFEQVVDVLQPERSLSHSPVFQVMFSLQNQSHDPVAIADLTVAAHDAGGAATAQFDLSLSLQEVGEEIVGVVNYASDLFEASTVERWVEYLQAVYGELARDTQRRLGEISVLSTRERARVLREFNATRVGYPQESLIHELFEEQAHRTPQAVAVVDATTLKDIAAADAVVPIAHPEHGDVRSAVGSAEPNSLTYVELNARANQLARYLQSQGVGPDRLVAIFLERGAPMVVGLLGVLKAGGAYVPLDPSYPKERLEYMLEDAAPAVVVTQGSLRSRLPESAARVVCLDSDWEVIGRQAQGNLASSEVGVTPSHLAYVIYTSGSTGLPKGVMVEHRNTVNFLYWAREAMDASIFEHTLASTSLNFDLAVYECFVPLSVGGSLRVVDNAVQVKPTDEVTLINTVPSALSALLDGGAVPSNTQVINLAGEALKGSLVERIFAETGVESVCNLYGPSETTTYSTWVRMRREEGFNPTIGRPVANTQIYLLDGEGQPAALGVVGEIHIGGAGVARGYLNREELTSERFLKDPFSTDERGRMYKTGDLGRWRADGTLEYLGRNDHQVKVRGFRIELGEIESRLLQHPDVQACVVVAREDEPGNKRLAAYFSIKEGTAKVTAPTGAASGQVASSAVALHVDALREHVRATLPEYMVPAAFVHLEQLPLTPNGKIDRKALPSPDVTLGLTTEYVAPRNDVERHLCEIWSTVLRMERVGVQDNFFALGGDSILSLQIVRAAHSRGYPIAVVDIFKYQTIAELARVAALASPHQTSQQPADLSLVTMDMNTPGVPSAELVDLYPLAPMQAIMVSQYERNRLHGLGIYHLQQWFRFTDPTPSAAAMRRAVDVMTATHPVLRTVLIRLPHGEVVQGIKRTQHVEFTEHDLQSLDTQQQERYVLTVTARDRATPFTVDGSSALLRYHWFRTAPDRFELLIAIHHAIDDGWGNQRFLANLFGSYEQMRLGRNPRLEPASNVYKEFVALAHEMASLPEASAFWAQRRLDATGVSRLKRRPVEPQNSFGRSLLVEPALGSKLRQLARRHSVSLKAVLLNAYAELIAATIGSVAPTIGVVTNGRSARLSDPLNALGLFWVILPVSARQDEATPWRERLRGVQEELAASEAYALYPLRRIEEQHGAHDLFFATFNFINFHNAVQVPAERGLELRGESGHDKFHYPLNYVFAVASADGALSVHVEYDNAYFSNSAIEDMNAKLLDILARCCIAAQLPQATSHAA